MSTKISAGDTVRLLTDGGFPDAWAEGDIAKVQREEFGVVFLEHDTIPGLMFWYNHSGFVNEVEKVIVTQQFKTGDIVEVLDAGTAGKHMKGVTTRVVEGNEDGSDFVYVEDPNGDGLFTQYGDTTSWIIDNENLRLVEVKQEEPEVKQELKVGDTVRVLKTSNWHKLGETGKVTEVDGLSIRVNDWWISPKEVELVTEKPKAKSQEIELEDVQKGDLIVCFFDDNGVEVRTKGIAHMPDYDKDWLAEEGGFLTYRDDLEIKGIYLLSRPEVKEPEPKGFDALDKSVKYFLKSEDSYSDYVLAYEGGRWTFGWVGSDIRVGAAQYEVEFTEGISDWEKPVPYEPTDLEKLSEAGLVGHKFQNWTTYKVTKKGNIKYKNPHDEWEKSSHNADSFIADVANGVMVKI